jgi:DNA (cytosine-5)-methyltransferase 1
MYPGALRIPRRQGSGEQSKVTRLRAISLFSNCGAGDLGYRAAGFRFEVLAEIDARRLSVALLNHRSAVGIPGDLRRTLPEVVAAYRSRAGHEQPALLAACPPCQGLSSAQSNRGQGSDADAGSRDARNLLVQVVVQAVLELQPRVAVVENVPAFLTRKVRDPVSGEGVSAATILIRDLSSDYVVYSLLTDLADYGVPQTRRRAFLTFVRKGERGLAKLQSMHRGPFPRPTHAPDYGAKHITLNEALASWNLPPLDAANSDGAISEQELHFVPIWGEQRYAMVAAIPANFGGSAWQNRKCYKCGTVDVRDEDAKCPVCDGPLMRPVTEDPNGKLRLIRGFRNSSYRRMLPDQPAATVTTASGHMGSDRTLHPAENRLLSPLECALLQTFPIDFKWGNAITSSGVTNVREMIGEAVPPKFTELHGRVLRALLTGVKAPPAISLSDPRVKRSADALNRAEVDAKSNLPA